MKKSIILLFIIAGLTGAIRAQVVFDKYYPFFLWGNAKGVFIQDDGYLLLATGSRNEYNVFFIKTDFMGDTIWTKSYYFPLDGKFTCDNDSVGNIYLGLSHGSISDIVKFSNEGEIIWTKELPEKQYSLAVTKENYLLVETHKEYKSFLYKFNSNGDSLWKVETMELNWLVEEPVKLTELDNGNILSTHYLIYEYLIPEQTNNIVISPEGDVLLSYKFDYNDTDFIINDQICLNNEIIAVGRCNTYNNKANYLIGYNSDGSINWAKQPKVNGYNISGLTNIVSNRNEEIVITGTSKSAFRFSLQSFTSEGDSLWARLNSYAMANVGDLKQTADGGYVLAVTFYEYGMNLVSLVKTDSLGRIGTLGISRIAEKNRLEVFPNPTTDQITFSTEIHNEGNVLLTDVEGRICLETVLSNDNKTISLASLKPGIYFYRLIVGDIIYTGKIIRT